MIHITSNGGWIGPLCWSNTMPAVVVPDHRFAGISSCLQPWGRTYWRLPGGRTGRSRNTSSTPSRRLSNDHRLPRLVR